MAEKAHKIEDRVPYSGADIAVLIPTKDRPDKVRDLLVSLRDQTERVGRILLVDGGQSVKAVVDEFSGQIPIDYVACQPPGQIRQRLAGLKLVTDQTPLVAFVDDDVVFDHDAIGKMIQFWNEAPVETAGVGFNLVNVREHRYSRLRALIGMSGRPGQVLRSGYNVSIVNQSRDIRVSWLAGGYTVWRLGVIRQFPQEELKTRWAAGEDVRFSYPIGKKYPLFVCAGARVRDMGQVTSLPSPSRSLFQGRKESLAYMYLVELHPELSRLSCLLMILVSSASLMIKSQLKENRSIFRGIGHIFALFDFVKSYSLRRSIKYALEDEPG